MTDGPNIPVAADLEAIGAWPQPVLRNLRITQAYHELSIAVALMTDPELVDFLREVDPTADTLRGSGADNWARLSQRMHFIADLFRLQHDNPTLFQPPFTPDQLRSIAAGRTPDGRL